MLRNFRQVFKSNQTPVAVIMMVALASMVAYLAPRGGGMDTPDSVVARVYGRDITVRDLQLEMGRVATRSLGRNSVPEGMMPILRAQAMRSLQEQKLVDELVERHGIMVTDAELRTALEARLRQMGAVDPNSGQLLPAAEINDRLRYNGQTLKMVEDEVNEQVARTKLLLEASAQVPVDQAWLDQENRVRNEKISFEAVTLAPDPAAVADPGPAKLEAFMKEAGARFQSGPRRVLAYVALTPASLEVAPVDDAALKALYEASKARFTELKASHILFKAQTEPEYQAALKKAQDLRVKLLAGQDFNKTAEQVSEDPSAKGNKGDLGWFKSGQMTKSFEDAALALKVGEISQPVRTSYGIHLIRLDGRKDKSFDEAKDELRAQLTRERFEAKAKDKLEQVRKRAGERGDLAAAARFLNLKYQTSLPAAEGSAIEGLPGSEGLVAEAFRLDVGQVSKVRQAQDAFVVFRVQAEKPIAIPPFAEVKDQVLAAWKLDEARRIAMDKAKDAAKGGDLKVLGTPAVQAGVTIAGLGELGRHPAIRKALLDTPAGQVTPALWTPDGKVWVARIQARTPAEPLTFASRKALVDSLQQGVAQQILEAELEHLNLVGRQHPGFSSLYGRYNGIWMNQQVMNQGPDSTGGENPGN